MSISYKRGLVSYLKKYDYFLFSVLLASLIFLIEALVHWIIFPGEHTLNDTQNNISFWNEFLYPNTHELYMRILFMGFIIFFGLIYQMSINKKRFLLTHDPFTNALNSRGIEPIITSLLASPEKRKGYIVIMKLRHLSIIQKVLGSEHVEMLVYDVVNRISRDHSKTFIGGFRFSNLVFFIEGKSIEKSSSTLMNSLIKTFDKEFHVEEIPFHLDFNLGVAPLSLSKNYNHLMNNAYKALSESFNSNVNIGLYKKSLDEKEKKKLFFIGEFYGSIKNNDFLIFLQPKVSLESGKTIGFEVLSRWEHPKKGIIPPSDYIEEAEDSQAINWLTKNTISKAKKIFQEIEKTGKELKVSFNLSAKDISNHLLLQEIINDFSKNSINPQKVIFEITESSFLISPKKSIANIKMLSNAGFRISLDDFGTGYTSFSYMKDFPVNEIKIDKSFIKDIHNQELNQLIVKNLVTLSHEVGFTVCAEGIETEIELACLKQLNCDVGQGFFWSPPLFYQDAINLIRKE